jgi:hypothetical protein
MKKISKIRSEEELMAEMLLNVQQEPRHAIIRVQMALKDGDVFRKLQSVLNLHKISQSSLRILPLTNLQIQCTCL